MRNGASSCFNNRARAKTNTNLSEYANEQTSGIGSNKFSARAKTGAISTAKQTLPKQSNWDSTSMSNFSISVGPQSAISGFKMQSKKRTGAAAKNNHVEYQLSIKEKYQDS
jgi:hypothetical protein